MDEMTKTVSISVKSTQSSNFQKLLKGISKCNSLTPRVILIFLYHLCKTSLCRSALDYGLISLLTQSDLKLLFESL